MWLLVDGNMGQGLKGLHSGSEYRHVCIYVSAPKEMFLSYNLCRLLVECFLCTMKTMEGEITNVWLLNVSLKHSLYFDVVPLVTWPGCTGCAADAWIPGRDPGFKACLCELQDNPAKPLILIVGNLDDPCTCKDLALQGIDTSVRKTCF